MAPLLELSEVTKVYTGNKVAVSQFTMQLENGVLGLLGPNGAGKTSLMRILATITRPTFGTVTWDGVDIVAHPDTLRRTLGYLPQSFGVYPHLTAREFLGYLAAVKGLTGRSARSRIEELLDILNLVDVGNRPLGKLSGGMRQRVGIALSLLNDPDLLILDEPTAGLDPEERTRFRSLLGDLGRDRIIILSTHIVSDIEAIAEDIAIMSNGELLRRDNPAGLLAAVEGLVWESLVAPEQLQKLRETHTVDRAVPTTQGVRVRIVSDSKPLPTATNVVPSLEDAYLAIVRGQLSSTFRART